MKLYEVFLRSPIGNAIGHVLEGLLLMAAIGLVFGPLYGWAAQAFYFLGRERRDEEIAANLNPFLDWWRGWNILRWTEDGRRDLFAPLLVNGAIAIVWHFL